MGLHQLSSSSSKLKPGPIEIITPKAPSGGESAIVRRRTSSTDTEDILPFSRIEFLLFASASGGSPIAFSIESSTLGPPGWQIHVEMSAVDKPCSARNRLTSSPR